MEEEPQEKKEGGGGQVGGVGLAEGVLGGTAMARPSRTCLAPPPPLPSETPTPTPGLHSPLLVPWRVTVDCPFHFATDPDQDPWGVRGG